MKKVFAIFCAIVLFISVNAQQTKTIVNDPNAQIRNVGNFTGISVSGGIALYISQGTTDAVAVSCDDVKNTDKITTEVKNGVLKIYVEQGAWNAWSWKNKNIKAYVTVKNLESLEASGACAVKITDALTSANLKVHISGASVLKGELKVGTVKFHLSGASVVTLSGKAETAKIEVSGASVLKAFDLSVNVCNAEVSGASNISIAVVKELDAEASGASTLRYKGEPVVKSSDATGASSIKKSN
jgi:hypothetical protein